jgi:C-terminal processing protease CtpA/Prc
MKKIKHLSLILALIFSGLIFNSCSKEKTLIETPTFDEIDEFIWTGLHNYYLWYKNVPDLASNKTNQQLINFLEPYTDRKKLFHDLLYQYGTVDKWSRIVKDYKELENSLQGVTLSMGWDLGLALHSTNKIFAVVRYVIPNSPAANAGVKRGDIIYTINGQVPTKTTYSNLFFNTNNMTIGFANIVGKKITPNYISKTLIAAEVHENPIYFYKTFDNINGKKVGYLVYNGFISNYNIDLNNVFSQFQGIDELILDLRYNGGGSVQTAIYLASMIYTTNTSKLFSISQYNNKLHAYFLQNHKKGSNYNKDYFASVIKVKDNSEVSINSLNLSKVYIITTYSSASASELLINGLKPYMDVVIIGDTTKGKYVGSITIKDYIDDKGTVNPNHKWAMQPIVFKIANSQGISDFVNGFAPTPGFLVNENFANLIPFGDENEPLLKTVLDHIRGITPSVRAQLKTVGIQFRSFGDSKDHIPFGKDMYVEEIQIR